MNLKTSNRISHAARHRNVDTALRLFLLCSAGAVLLASPAHASMAGKKPLHGHVPKVLARLPATGNLPETNRLNLAIGLELRDRSGLDDFLAQVYNPASPKYRQYLTPAQFAERFGPTESDYTAVIAFAKRNNMTVTAMHTNRLLLDVNASVADIQRAFQIALRTYQHPTEGREFYAPDTEPIVEAQLPLVDVSGLNNYILPHPKSLRMETGNEVAPKTGSASGGAYIGNDFRAAYLGGVTLTGAGQSVGLLEFDGFYAADIAAYETASGLPSVPVQTVLLDGFNGAPTRGPNSGNPEVSLDIEMAISMAPGLESVVVYEAGPSGLQNDVLSSMAANSAVRQLSCSWGWGGGPKATTDNLFKQLAAQGQSFFNASGDTDAFPAGQVDDPTQTYAPSSSPYITQVGGTTLTTTSAAGAWESETVWNAGGGEGSGGGISSYYSIPSWQTGISMSANGGSTANRNIPDVSLVADNIFVYYGNGKSGAFVGTSASTPLWAGLTALMNEKLASTGNAPLGFLNPAIYALGKSGSYSSTFHDITTGNNTWSGSPNSFYAVQGYDLCTGWGTPIGQSFITALTGPPDALRIVPGTGFIAYGPTGGPFGPIPTTYSLSNSGTTSLTWSFLNTPSWLSLSPGQGSLAPNATTSVIINISSAAESMTAGSYSANIVLTNWNSHAAQIISFELQVGQSLVQNGGFETGDLSNWALVGNTSTSGPTGGTLYNGVQSSTDTPSVVHSGTYGMFLGDTQLATLSQDLPTLPGQAYLLSLWLANPTNGSGQQFLVNWIVSNGSTNTLYNIPNPAGFPWTNLQFIVAATATNTILQFGAENVPDAFGLDDVSVTPIATARFKSFGWSSGAFQLTWRTIGGLVYQVQYTTDLGQANWINLGIPQTAVGSSLTMADSGAISSSGQRFYRLMALP